MDLCNQSCLSGKPSVRPSVLRGKNLNVRHYAQDFRPDSFNQILSIPFMLIGSIDL